MNDLIDRQAAIAALEDVYMSFGIYREQRAASKCIEVIKNLPSAQPDMSEYSDKLWRTAYERGKKEVQHDH